MLPCASHSPKVEALVACLSTMVSNGAVFEVRGPPTPPPCPHMPCVGICVHQYMPWLLGVVQCFTGCLQTKAMTSLHGAARRVGLQLAPQRAVHPCGIGWFHGANMAYVALKGGHVTAWAMCALPCPKCRSTRVVCACRVKSSCNNNHSVVFLKCMPPICQFRAAKNAWHVCSTTYVPECCHVPAIAPKLKPLLPF